MHDILPRAATIRAAIRLLADDDRFVVDVCRRHLLSWGEHAREEIEHAASDDPDPRVRSSARAVLRFAAIEQWSSDFAALVKASRVAGQEVDLLGEGLGSLAELLGGVDATPELVDPQLDVLAIGLRSLVAGKTSTTAARHLGEFLAIDAGLRGSGNLAPRRRHVRPDRVLRGGRGTSALLTAIALVAGRRAGLELTAVHLPDFFLVRVHGRRRVLVDPYHDGRTVTKSDCLRYLRARVVGSPASACLADVEDAAVLLGLIEDVIRAHDGRQHVELRRALRRAAAALGRPTRRQPS